MAEEITWDRVEQMVKDAKQTKANMKAYIASFHKGCVKPKRLPPEAIIKICDVVIAVHGMALKLRDGK